MIKMKELTWLLSSFFFHLHRKKKLAFMDIKLKCIEKLTDKAEVREALAKNKLRTKMQEWNFYFTIPEGVQAVQQISYIHSYPRKMYGRYMEQIDETLAAIDEMYK